MGDAGADRPEVNARIVYWGVEGAGKESNLRAIHGKLRPDHRGRLEPVPTALDPSVCSWRLPIELGEIAGVRTRIQVVAVPGGPEQAPTRKQLLDRADGVVLVVDARRDRIDENVASFEELRSALGAYGRSLESIPLVVQYNHHDESDPYVLEELHRKLDVKGAAAFEAKASDGTGVLPTLTTISKRVVRQLREGEPSGRQAAPTVQPAPPPAPVSLGATLLRAPREVEPLASGGAALGAGARSEAKSIATAVPPISDALTAPVNLRTTAVVLDPPAPSLDLEEAALSPDIDLLDERDDAVSRAQDLLDPSWSDVASDLDAPLDASSPLGPAALPGGWHVVSAGRPTVIGAATLQLPLRIANDAGEELGFRLTVSLEPLLDE
jgi:signal recognition particle receptor subunit beta